MPRFPAGFFEAVGGEERLKKHQELVVRVREDIANAKENGFDVLRDEGDADIAGDLVEKTTGYEEYEDNPAPLIAAIAEVRKTHEA